MLYLHINKECMKALLSTIICFFILIQVQFAQFNIQIGYGAAYTNPTVNNQILDLYNKENSWMSKPLSDLQFFHGIVLGAKYSFENIAIGLNWKNRGKGLISEGIQPSNNTEYQYELFYKYQSFGFNIETAGTFLSLGTSLDYGLFQVKDRVTGQKKKTQFLSEDNWGSHFYLNINLPTRSYLGITIQPYYFVNWNSINLSKLSERLLNTAITANSLGKFNQIGVSLIFNNGPQKNY